MSRLGANPPGAISAAAIGNPGLDGLVVRLLRTSVLLVGVALAALLLFAGRAFALTVNNSESEYGIAGLGSAVEETEAAKCAREGKGVPAGTEKSDTQAGGHPFCISNEFVVNFVQPPGAGGPIPVSVPKEVQFELPPGFVGNPQNSPEQCTSAQFANAATCPPNSAVGFLRAWVVEGTIGTLLGSDPFGELINQFGDPSVDSSLIYNLKPAPGHPAQFGFSIVNVPFILEAKVRGDRDLGVTVGDTALGRFPDGTSALGAKSTFCAYGAQLTPTQPLQVEYSCKSPGEKSKPFLTNPTQCTENGSGYAPTITVHTNPWSEPAGDKSKSEYLYTGPPVVEGQAPPAGAFVTGCNQLSFNPQLSLKPENTGADQPTGLTSVLTIPQANSPRTLGTPQLKNAEVTLPEGLTISPTGAEGLEACSDAAFGYGPTAPRDGFGPGSNEKEPIEPGECPEASQVGEVEAYTPVLAPAEGRLNPASGRLEHFPGEPGQLKGKVFVGQPECTEEPCSQTDVANGRLVRLFLELKDEAAGLIVKLVGTNSLNPVTGQLTAKFENQPRTPFEELTLKIKGTHGSLETPQTCGTASLHADFTPWSAPEGPSSVFEEPSFSVACPPGTGSFAPRFAAGTANPSAAHYSPFGLTLSREGGEQNIGGLQVTEPPGLTAKIAGVPECPEEQANKGNCPEDTRIGTATAGAGPAGSDPYFEQGAVYFTGPYKGAPFGLSIVIPAVAGPFNLGLVVTRQAIEVNPKTSAATVVSDPLPQIHDGVQLRLRQIKVDLKEGFILNPTNCAPQPIAATFSSTQGAISQPAAPYHASGCQNLPFKPSFTASTEAKSNKALGASFRVKITAKPGEANIAKTELQVPAILPARLTTLQKACVDAVFNQDPANCPEGSVIGTATARSPLLSVPLTGPAILVSHGGAAFPDVIFVLQGQGIRLDVDGGTDIKGQTTYSKFETVPDQPVESFETVLPRGPHGIFTANGNLCKGSILAPTKITAQNGAVISQNTHITVTGCPKKADPSRAQLLAAALKACKKKPTRQQAACRARAYRLYGPAKKAAKAKKAKKATVTAKAASVQGAATGSSSASGATPALAGVEGASGATGAAKPALGAEPALAAEPAGEACSPAEEKLRSESDINLETNKPYSSELPECRAYEMVSPQDKQGSEASIIEFIQTFASSPDGETAGFASTGDFSEPLNYTRSLSNSFISKRTSAGWKTQSALAPAGSVEIPSAAGLFSDLSPNLRTDQVSCGTNGFQQAAIASFYACARRHEAEPWTKATTYQYSGKGAGENVYTYSGASSDMTHVFIHDSGSGLLPEDEHAIADEVKGIYEITGVGSPTPRLRLVNVDNGETSEKELTGGVGLSPRDIAFQSTTGPLLGDFRFGPNVLGTAYHAISEDGERVFFTATPTEKQLPEGGQQTQTVYARVPCEGGPRCTYVEEEKEGQVLRQGLSNPKGETKGRETVAVSNPPNKECTGNSEKCAPQPATYQGASADGSKVFFTTEQELLPTDKDVANGEGRGNDLYMYDEVGKPTGHLVQLSEGNCGEKKTKRNKKGEEEVEETTCGNGAEVQGVVRNSSDGSHVYFVARGLLTAKPNASGQAGEKGAENLYGVDTATKTPEVKFIAQLSSSDEALWGGKSKFGSCRQDRGEGPETQGPVACDLAIGAGSREAQMTPDGEYLAFSTYEHLTPADTNPGQAVYAYNFRTGGLTWISGDARARCEQEPNSQGKEKNAGEKNECQNENQNAEIAPLPGATDGATADIGDLGRAISDNGEYIIFMSMEKLTPQDRNVGTTHSNNLYLWHNGKVSLISPGGPGISLRGPGGGFASGELQYGSMSASGSDIFLLTKTPLVGQDQDQVADVYDARINGGFPAPVTSSSCFPGCQPGSGQQRQLEGVFSGALPASLFPTGGANITSFTNLTPSITLHGAKLKGNSVVATFRTSEAGTVTLSGSGVKTASKAVAGGSSQVTLALSSAGKFAMRKHRKSTIAALLKVGLYSGHASITLTL